MPTEPWLKGAGKYEAFVFNALENAADVRKFLALWGDHRNLRGPARTEVDFRRDRFPRTRCKPLNHEFGSGPSRPDVPTAGGHDSLKHQVTYWIYLRF